MGPDAMISTFWMSSFKPAFSVYPCLAVSRCVALFTEPMVGKAWAQRLEEDLRSRRTDTWLQTRLLSPDQQGSPNTACLLPDAAA